MKPINYNSAFSLTNPLRSVTDFTFSTPGRLYPRRSDLKDIISFLEKPSRYVVQRSHLHPNDKLIGNLLVREIQDASPWPETAAVFWRPSDWTLTVISFNTEPSLCPALTDLAAELSKWPFIWWLEGSTTHIPYLGVLLDGPLELRETVSRSVAAHQAQMV